MTKKSIVLMVRPVLAEVAVTAAAILVLAFLMLRMEWDREAAGTGVMVIYGIACLLGGCLGGASAEQRKFLRGLEYGILYFLLWCLMSLAAGGMAMADSVQVLKIFGICAATGMAGGMLSRIFSE